MAGREDLLGVSVEAAREWLERTGYALHSRVHGWTECLASRDGERWLGRGSDEDSALLDALRQILPSHAARAALARALGAEGPAGGRTPAEERPAPRDAGGPGERARERGPASLAGPGRPPERAAPTAEPGAGAHPPVPEPGEGEGVAPGTGPEGGEALAAEPPAATGNGALGAARERLPRYSQAEASELIDALWAEIHSTSDEAALWVPERQRLLILQWMAAARHVQDAARDGRFVFGDVYRIAQRLGHLAKIWWPGSVRALQIDAYPAGCADELGLDAQGAPSTWEEVSQAAGRRLEEVQEEGEAQGRGEHGWADDPWLAPGPSDPESDLRAIKNFLEELAGPLQVEPKAIPALDPSTAEATAERTERLRWLRGSVEDTATWGMAMGRLRWIADRCAWAPAALEVALDPLHHPREPSWAARFGYDPLKKIKQRRKKELLQNFPGAGRRPDLDQLVAWLRDAFEPGVFTTERLVRELLPHAELLGGLDPEAIPGCERVHRTKLRKLKAALGQAAAPEAGGGAGEEQEERAEEPGEPTPQPFEDRLLAEILPRTRDKSALVVTNRGDPELDATLERTFEFTVEHREHDVRKIQAAADRIRSGSFDLVLSATGFQSHKVDAMLAKACQSAGVPYVRVNRARRQACIRALAREFGLLHQRS